VFTDELVRAAIDNLSAAIGEAKAEIEVGANLPTLLGNPVQLTRVFQNLIGNAIKYRAPERAPKVSVSVAQFGKEWVFSISDNGIGIEPQHFERIFGVFQRLHSRDQYEGTGIGLAVVKRIIEQHGGRIWVESEAGKGSTFKFTLGKGGMT
jgi:light-regulated signal transduction histidine kinase (bacteriophytochrome)